MKEPTAKNIRWHDGPLSREQREELLGQRGCIVWFTGLSGSGKSTLARALEVKLLEAGHFAYVLDGDNVRHGLNRDLGFEPEDRKENIRRCAEVARLFADAGIVAITAFISPYRQDRALARLLNQGMPFIEVYLSVSLQVCIQRDVKGLYEKARSGEITNMTGVSAPYEEPRSPDLTLDTDRHSVAMCVDEVMRYMYSRDVISMMPEDRGRGHNDPQP